MKSFGGAGNWISNCSKIVEGPDIGKSFYVNREITKSGDGEKNSKPEKPADEEDGKWLRSVTESLVSCPKLWGNQNC